MRRCKKPTCRQPNTFRVNESITSVTSHRHEGNKQTTHLVPTHPKPRSAEKVQRAIAINKHQKASKHANKNIACVTYHYTWKENSPDVEGGPQNCVQLTPRISMPENVKLLSQSQNPWCPVKTDSGTGRLRSPDPI